MRNAFSTSVTWSKQHRRRCASRNRDVVRGPLPKCVSRPHLCGARPLPFTTRLARHTEMLTGGISYKVDQAFHDVRSADSHSRIARNESGTRAPSQFPSAAAARVRALGHENRPRNGGPVSFLRVLRPSVTRNFSGGPQQRSEVNSPARFACTKHPS